jgi:chaperonin GroES
MKVIGNRILVQVEMDTRPPESLIQIPESAKPPPTTGIVKTVGTTEIPEELKPGVRCLFNKYGGSEILLDGKHCRLLSVNEVMGVYE